MKSLLFSSALVALLLSGAADASLQTELTAKETQLKTLAQSSAALFQSRCNALADTTCSQPACGSTFKTSDGFTCLSGMGSSCGDSCPGMTRSETKSTIWIPKETSFTSADAQAFIASTRGADSLMATARSATSGGLKAWQLIGDTTGVTRVFPGNPQSRSTSSCSNYDARTRPWYVAAASGPKDLVLLVDVSGSMQEIVDNFSGATREDLVRPAVDAVLDTLTQNDFVTLIPFSGTAQVVYSSTPVRATTDNIAAIKSAWASFRFGGQTFYGRAFTAAFNALDVTGEAVTSGCSKIIMFLTDGNANDGNDYATAITTGQAKLDANNQAHIFTVTLGSSVNSVIPKAIACAHRGVYENIKDGDDPLVALRGYYQFLAAGLTSGEVRWSNPYIDAFGLGQMVTAGMPIFDESGPIKQLVGVAGADVTVSELEATGVNFNGILNELITRSKTCPTTNFTDCLLQQLRKNSNTGTESICDAPAPTPASCESAGDVYVRTPCSAGTNTINTYLCEDLTSTTLKASPVLTTSEVSCCTKIDGYTGDTEGCSGASSAFFSTTLSLIVAGLMVFLVALF